MSAFVELLPAGEAGPHNPEWHKLRRDGVTASEIAAVLGISPWESPFSLFWQKVNGWETPENPEMAAGRRAEPVIAAWYDEQADHDMTLVVAGLYAHADRPWQMATPDRLLCGPCPLCNDLTLAQSMACEQCEGTGLDWRHPLALLECKYVIGSWDGWGAEGTDQVPVHVRAQGLWQADVLGVDEVHIAAWHGADLRVYIVRRDAADLAVMRKAGRDFLDRIDAGQPPDIDDHAATLRTVKALHPDIEDRVHVLTAETAEGYRTARSELALAQHAADAWEARVRSEMGAARRAEAPDGSFVASRSLFDVGEQVRAGYSVDRLNPARGAK